MEKEEETEHLSEEEEEDEDDDEEEDDDDGAYEKREKLREKEGRWEDFLRELCYNQYVGDLEKLLASLGSSYNFFSAGKMSTAMPRIEVDGCGILSFPVPAGQIEKLVAQAVRAPYGRGEETILDLSVRKVWQLPKDGVKVSGAGWQKTFDSILEKVCVTSFSFLFSLFSSLLFFFQGHGPTYIYDLWQLLALVF